MEDAEALTRGTNGSAAEGIEGIEALARSASERSVLQWHRVRKQLSVGLELEAFLPDLGNIQLDTLIPLSTSQDIFRVVAARLTEQLSQGDDGLSFRVHELQRPDSASKRAKGVDRRAISSQDEDWGEMWTAKGDGSIHPSAAAINPMPIELVSPRMRFEQFDVSLFCDVTHTLRSAPFGAETNDSTGFHLHFGKYPGCCAWAGHLCEAPCCRFLFSNRIGEDY